MQNAKKKSIATSTPQTLLSLGPLPWLPFPETLPPSYQSPDAKSPGHSVSSFLFASRLFTATPNLAARAFLLSLSMAFSCLQSRPNRSERAFFLASSSTKPNLVARAFLFSDSALSPIPSPLPCIPNLS
eukprot:c27084_g1_i2 orf=3-386(-)